MFVEWNLKHMMWLGIWWKAAKDSQTRLKRSNFTAKKSRNRQRKVPTFQTGHFFSGTPLAIAEHKSCISDRVIFFINSTLKSYPHLTTLQKRTIISRKNKIGHRLFVLYGNIHSISILITLRCVLAFFNFSEQDSCNHSCMCSSYPKS